MSDSLHADADIIALFADLIRKPCMFLAEQGQTWPVTSCGWENGQRPASDWCMMELTTKTLHPSLLIRGDTTAEGQVISRSRCRQRVCCIVQNNSGVFHLADKTWVRYGIPPLCGTPPEHVRPPTLNEPIEARKGTPGNSRWQQPTP